MTLPRALTCPDCQFLTYVNPYRPGDAVEHLTSHLRWFHELPEAEALSRLAQCGERP